MVSTLRVARGTGSSSEARLDVETNWLARGTGSSSEARARCADKLACPRNRFLGKPRCAQVPQGTLPPGSSRNLPPKVPHGTLPPGFLQSFPNLLLAFFIWKALQAFKALQTGKGMQASEALGFLHNFQKIAFGVLYLESLACL